MVKKVRLVRGTDLQEGDVILRLAGDDGRFVVVSATPSGPRPDVALTYRIGEGPNAPTRGISRLMGDDLYKVERQFKPQSKKGAVVADRGRASLPRFFLGEEQEGPGAAEPVFLYVDETDVVMYSYMEWVKIQSELSAGLHDEREYTGTWTVVLEGQNEPEPFTTEPGEEVRYEESESNEYGHRRVFIKGSRSGAGYCGNIGLLDV